MFNVASVIIFKMLTRAICEKKLINFEYQTKTSKFGPTGQLAKRLYTRKTLVFGFGVGERDLEMPRAAKVILVSERQRISKCT